MPFNFFNFQTYSSGLSDFLCISNLYTRAHNPVIKPYCYLLGLYRSVKEINDLFSISIFKQPSAPVSCLVDCKQLFGIYIYFLKLHV